MQDYKKNLKILEKDYFFPDEDDGGRVSIQSCRRIDWSNNVIFSHHSSFSFTFYLLK